MKVFISSTSKDLQPYRRAAAEIVRDAFGAEAIMMEHFPSDFHPIVTICRQLVESSDLVILLQAFRRGTVPTVAQGGDGQSSMTALEIAAADDRKIPVLAFLANEKWPGDQWEREPADLAWTENFRNGLNRSAKFFAWEQDERLPSFGALLRQELANFRLRGIAPVVVSNGPSIRLRRIDADPPLPDQPYPLLSPYEHPGTFAGRQSEIAQLASFVQSPPLVLCVHAPSGAGKSSLLLAGLLPHLRKQGFSVSVERLPGDPGLARRLVLDLIESLTEAECSDDDQGLLPTFASLMARVYELSGKPAVLILDQFDEVMRDAHRRQASLARIGPLLAATAQRLPGIQGFACKWVLCYRHEFHGEVRTWLGDVLGEAVASGHRDVTSLPHDLSNAQKSQEWSLPVMGKPAPGLQRRGVEHSSEAFLAAIAQPLSLMRNGVHQYPFEFTTEGAGRLASLFARARQAYPNDPLVPELQVILHHLLQRALGGSSVAAEGGRTLVEVPDDGYLQTEFKSALTNHLIRVLQRVVPEGRDGEAVQLTRTRVTLVLRHLADDIGRRSTGISETTLVAMLGDDGSRMAMELGGPDARIIVIANGRCVLSHDRLAEVVVDILQNDAYVTALNLDRELIATHHAIERKAALFSHDPYDHSALFIKEERRFLIEKNRDALLNNDSKRAWWNAASRYEPPLSRTPAPPPFSLLRFFRTFIMPRERLRLERVFGRSVPRHVLEQLISRPELLRLGGEARDMSVLFCDVRGFTTVTERGSPEEIVQMLNEYFAAMVEVVFRHGGTVDKFVGDMIMALFGAPLDDRAHADHAVEAALAMVDELGHLNEKWKAEGNFHELDIGVGVNSGRMIAGNIGSETTMNYTVVGDAVNLGSRLESLNKQYGTRIIISAGTRDRLTRRFSFRPLGDVVVKGKTRPVDIFEVLPPE